jgi:hypothetical protein
MPYLKRLWLNGQRTIDYGVKYMVSHTRRLSKWNIICWPKDQGGLGIEVLELKNKSLLSKWLFKLINEDGVWQEILRNKYLHSKTLSHVTVFTILERPN